MIVNLPIRTESETNLREHYRTRAKRVQAHRGIAQVVMTNAVRVKPELPCTVTLTRIAPRTLDDDNLSSSLKAVRDGIADWFGINDRDSRVAYKYMQRRGKPRCYAVEVQIE